MSEKTATKDYVVVFDQVDVHTGDLQNVGPGIHPVATSKSFFRGDTVQLDAETAERHLASGAVIDASDKRAKLVERNPERSTGVRRDPEVAYGALQLTETEPAVAGGEGARRTTGGKLGTKQELAKMKVGDLKALAATHGVEVEPKDTRTTLAAKLSKVRTTGTDAGTGEPTLDNPGMQKDTSPPNDESPLESKPDDE